MADDLNLNDEEKDEETEGKGNSFISNLKSKFKNEKQWHWFVKISIIGVLFLVVGFALVLLLHTFKPPTMMPVKKSPVASIINIDKLSKQTWVSKGVTQLRENNAEMKKLKNRDKLLEKELHDAEVIKSSKINNKQIVNNQRPGGIFTPPIPFQNNNNNVRYAPPATPAQQKVNIVPITNPINTILNSAPKREKNKKKRKPTGFYIPAGAFTQGLLLNGLDAPASMKGKSNPYPTLIRLTNLSFLPNRYRLSMKGCFVLAEGYGSLSSERVYLRTVTLSCVVKGGKGHISAPIKGYIVGQHGKVGLRGKVVTKQGAILAREFLAGLMQGFGSVVQEQSQTMSYSALGATSTINPANVGEAGLGQGLGTAAGELSKFYSKMAGSMMPVVVVGAGRKLTLVLTHGFYATYKKNVTYAKNLKNNTKRGGKK